MATCKSCDAPITFATTAAGKAMPLDAEPVLGGNLEVRDGQVVVVVPDPDKRRYKAHFASCPAAKTFRRPRG